MNSPFPLVGTEAQQRRDIAGFVEFLIVFYVKEFQAVTQGNRNYGVGDVPQFACLPTAGRAVSHQVCVQVSATCAFHGGVPEIVSQQKRLYFSEFQGTQHTAKPCNSKAVAFGLVENLPC